MVGGSIRSGPTGRIAFLDVYSHSDPSRSWKTLHRSIFRIPLAQHFLACFRQAILLNGRATAVCLVMAKFSTDREPASHCRQVLWIPKVTLRLQPTEALRYKTFRPLNSSVPWESWHW